ncbi:hypothetical protein FDA94_11495 [Herbidospora galbida]|uniref:Uncharacterized protein n=1 Tax=Herbidospora galbida TaxID=2575442 RepID=A0A4U3MKS9_9ACTN|nr:hypothetical protein [Herbidospora galbida]TKK89124.1 hypothetical protein FDA94_11495 [Herbidospora galbida]
MVEIFNQRIDGGALEQDPDYHFTVTYKASFDPQELGDTFHEFVRLCEEDDVSGDDFITAQGPAGNVFSPGVLPQQNDNRPGHQGMKVVDRRLGFVLSREVADTETGHEEIYADIWLRSSGNLQSTGWPGSDSGKATTNVGDFNP